MFISGLLIVFGIPIVWLKPSTNLSESLTPKVNDTLRSKRRPEYFDFIHQFIEKHANCADQQLAPLKSFANFKPFETFVYPYGFSQPSLYPIQQQHTQYTVSNYDPDILNYMANPKELEPIVVATKNGRISPYLRKTYKDMPMRANGNVYRLRNNNPRQFRPQKVSERNRQIIIKGKTAGSLQQRNSTKSVINGQNKNNANRTRTTKLKLKSIEESKRTMKNVVASDGIIKTTQNCTCPNLLQTNNSTFNLEQTLDILVQELQNMTNFRNLTEVLKKNSTTLHDEDILRMLEKFKALLRSVTNRTSKTKTKIETTTDVFSNDEENILVLLGNLTKITALGPIISKPEISIINRESNTDSDIILNKKKNFKDQSQNLTLKSDSFASTRTSSTESLKILNTLESNDSAEENEVGISGSPALELVSNDLLNITIEMQNLVKNLRSETLLKSPHEYAHVSMDKKDDINILNLLPEVGTVNPDNDTFKTENFPKESLLNVTWSNGDFNKTKATPNFQLIDKSLLINSTLNISLKNNGSFKTIQIKQQSPGSSNNNMEIFKRKKTNLGTPNAKSRPSDMTGTSSRFIKFLRNRRQNESITLPDDSYYEPIVSEIYPAKIKKSPLTIYLHRIEEKSQISKNKPVSKNWRILKSGEFDNDNDDISTMSQDCDDCDDSVEIEELQKQQNNQKPIFPELFNYDNNFT